METADLIKLAASQYETARDTLAAYDETLGRLVNHPQFRAGESVPLADGRIAVVVDSFAADNRIFRPQALRRFTVEFAKPARR